MRAGRKRTRLQVQETTNTRTDGGGYEPSWSKIGEVSAEVVPLSGKEFLESQSMEGNVTHKIRIRYTREFALTRSHRLVDILNSRVFNIQHVLNLSERNREWEVMAKEEV